MAILRKFTADNAGMAECQAFLTTLCESPKPQIIMDEIVSNIVRCSGATVFEVTFAPGEGNVTEMTFKDNGRPFDPTREIADPDITAKLEDRQIGGLGMFMVKKMSKSVTYERQADANVLTVIL